MQITNRLSKTNKIFIITILSIFILLSGITFAISWEMGLMVSVAFCIYFFGVSLPGIIKEEKTDELEKEIEFLERLSKDKK